MDEDSFIPVSRLQDTVFCERRAFLAIREAFWVDSSYTLEGMFLHEHPHAEGRERQGDVVVARGLRLRSLELGLVGMADVTEFHAVTDKQHDLGVGLEGLPGNWRPYPVEYKRGVLRRELSFEVQLCAQGLCLKEMLGVPVERGALYFSKSRRRLEVEFDGELTQRTMKAAVRLRELLSCDHPPPPRFEKKCRSCSLLDVCMPKTLSRRSVRSYVRRYQMNRYDDDMSESDTCEEC